MAENTIIDVHYQTIKMDVHELARQLVGHLGATLVATLAGVRDRKLPYRWAKADGPIPNDEAIVRLQTAHQIWQLLSDTDDDYVARAWFIGVNPRLGDVQPVMALRERQLAETLAAARAFAAGTDE